MKKTMIVAAILAIAGTQLQTARAGDREWATAGRILTGVAIGAVIASAVKAQADCSVSYYSAPGYAYCPPPVPVVYVPRPVVVYRAPVVCAPPVVTVRYGHGVRHGYGHHGRW